MLLSMVRTGVYGEACARAEAKRWDDQKAVSPLRFMPLGNPLEFILSGGQASDVGQTEALLQLTQAGAAALLGDNHCVSEHHFSQHL